MESIDKKEKLRKRLEYLNNDKINITNNYCEKTEKQLLIYKHEIQIKKYLNKIQQCKNRAIICHIFLNLWLTILFMLTTGTIEALIEKCTISVIGFGVVYVNLYYICTEEYRNERRKYDKETGVINFNYFKRNKARKVKMYEIKEEQDAIYNLNLTECEKHTNRIEEERLDTIIAIANTPNINKKDEKLYGDHQKVLKRSR